MDRKTIFISYRREDNNGAAREIAKILESNGFSVFFDKGSIKPAEKFPAVIENAVRDAIDVILVVSRSYFGRDSKGDIRIFENGDWCYKELSLAVELDKHIIPIVLDPAFFHIDQKSLTDRTTEKYERIKTIFDLNYLEFSRGEKAESFLPEISKALSRETIEDSRKNLYIDKLTRIAHKQDQEKYNIDLRDLVLGCSESVIDKYFYPIFDAPNDIEPAVRFAAYYAVYTFYRRMSYQSKLCSLVEKYSGCFTDFPFNQVTLSQYHLYRYENDHALADELDKAIEHARSAKELLRSNSGVQVTFAELIAIGSEEDPAKYADHVEDAIESIHIAMGMNPGYAKHYYILGMLESLAGRFDSGIMNIRKAVDLENTESKDAYIRIVNYYDSIHSIKLRKLEARLMARCGGQNLPDLAETDSFIYRSHGEWGEDRTFRGNNYWGVIDGATPIDVIETCGFMSQAEWFADGLKHYIESKSYVSDFPKICLDYSKQKPAAVVFQAEDYNMPSATIAAVTENDGKLNGFVLGDCGITIRTVDGSVHSFTDNRSHKYSDKTLAAKNRAVENGLDTADAIRQQKILNRGEMNTDGGYWTVAAKGDFTKEFLRIEFPLSEVTHCIIYTDGLTQFLDELGYSPEDLLTDKLGGIQKFADFFDKYRTGKSGISSRHVKEKDDIGMIFLTNRHTI